MKKVLYTLLIPVLLLSTTPAFSCVMWGQHTCIQDCKNVPFWLYPVCLYGGTNNH